MDEKIQSIIILFGVLYLLGLMYYQSMKKTMGVTHFPKPQRAKPVTTHPCRISRQKET